ncbi:MAG: LON peptidase substrate-binding domain-containing protein [Opitutales bacterium]
MSDELEIPAEVPIMILKDTVLFPQAILPLYIFEPCYRLMLDEVLAHDRIFAVAGVREDVPETDLGDSPHRVAGVGIVRACRKNPDGTSNLILQGLARIKCGPIVSETPYPRIRIQPLPSEQDGSTATLAAMQSSLIGLIETQKRLGAGIPKEVLQFLGDVKSPEICLDLAISTLCPSGTLKQELLETGGILARFKEFENFLRAQIEQIKLENKLKGKMNEDDLGQN